MARPTLSPEEVEIDRLRRQVDKLKSQLGEALCREKLAKKHLRDSYLGAILSGMCAAWQWSHTSPQALAEKAELLLECVMRQRKLWEQGQSPMQQPVPQNVAPAQPQQKAVK